MQIDRLCGPLIIKRSAHYPGVNGVSVGPAFHVVFFRNPPLGRNLELKAQYSSRLRNVTEAFGRTDNYLSVIIKAPSASGTRLSVVRTARVRSATSERFSREALLLSGSWEVRTDATAGCYAVHRRIGDRRCVSSSPRRVCVSYCEGPRRARRAFPRLRFPGPVRLYCPLALHEWKDVGILTVKVWLLLRWPLREGVQGQPGLLESTRRIVVFRARHTAAGLPRDARGLL